MNTNLSITCEVCEQDTDCRIGYSNRKIQPLSFACPHCGSLMQVTLDIANAPASDFQFKSCYPSRNQPKEPFDGKNPFVNLHLDLPVRFGKYIAGLTPFIVAMQDLNDPADIDPEAAIRKIEFHKQRLEQLNHFSSKADKIKTIIGLYTGSDKLLFKKQVGDFLQKDQGTSLKPEDVNASLYQFVSFVFLPFVHFNDVQEVVNGFTNLTTRLHGKPFSDFVENIVSSGFLKALQKDCLKIYPEVYGAEMPMRPALYLDLTNKYEKAKTAARISTKDFQSYKDLYKDIIEVFARQLILIAGINNIIKRGSSDSFKVVGGGALSSLEKFSSKTLSDKLKYLDDCWYTIDKEAIDAAIRNAIAHNNVQYNEITHGMSGVRLATVCRVSGLQSCKVRI
ncbi:MAG: hypothetical protein A2X82_01625 [Geobacteraceae bacterium GWC2_55_20]|nr:MAG: hypothetical protein A2X82_01625 [Geobacteraceae bacterium GWC2_55_20]HCE69532.1 hypothetical protein [Geobacter sp.]